MADKNSLLQDIRNYYLTYCVSHRAWEDLSKTFVAPQKVAEKVGEMEYACDSLEKSVRNLLDLAGNNGEETRRFIMMLAHTLICKLEWMCENFMPVDECWEAYEEVMSLLESLCDDQKVAILKLFATTMIFKTPVADNDYYFEVLKQQVATLEPLNANLTGAKENFKDWNGHEVFGIRYVVDVRPAFEMAKYVFTHSEKYVKENFDKIHKMMIDKSTEELKSIFTYNLIGQKLKSNSYFDTLRAIKTINERIAHLLNLGYFKQAHHILSLGMYHSVKIRRSLSPEDRYAVDVPQGRLSGNFALYGLMIITGMLSEMRGGHRKRNDHFIELTDALEDGVKVYSSEFPIEYPNNKIEAIKILKRAVKWSDRAIFLCKKWQPNVDDLNQTKNSIIEMLDVIAKKRNF